MFRFLKTGRLFLIHSLLITSILGSALPNGYWIPGHSAVNIEYIGNHENLLQYLNYLHVLQLISENYEPTIADGKSAIRTNKVCLNAGDEGCSNGGIPDRVTADNFIASTDRSAGKRSTCLNLMTDCNDEIIGSGSDFFNGPGKRSN